MKADRIKAWVQASRPPFFIATLVPLFMGLVLASGPAGSHPWNPDRFLLVVAACFMVHLATNLANDYFDHIVGTDSGDSIGGSRVIQEGKISPASLLRAIVGLYAAACLIALYLVVDLRLFAVFPLALFAFFSSLFYVAPPVRYGYHGLGELFVGINMGPIMVVGTYWVMAGEPALRPLYVSIPVGLMVAFILYFQSLPDMATDLAAGKHTLAVRLGKRGALAGLVVFSVLVYASMAVLVWAGVVSWLAVLGVASVPLALKVVLLAARTGDWVLLDGFGKYVRMFYFINGLALVAGLF